jgi:hypothetical protein
MGFVVVLFREKLADLCSRGSSGARACYRGLDDGGKMENLFSLSIVSVIYSQDISEVHTEFAAPDSQKSLCRSRQHPNKVMRWNTSYHSSCGIGFWSVGVGGYFSIANCISEPSLALYRVVFEFTYS